MSFTTVPKWRHLWSDQRRQPLLLSLYKRLRRTSMWYVRLSFPGKRAFLLINTVLYPASKRCSDDGSLYIHVRYIDCHIVVYWCKTKDRFWLEARIWICTSDLLKCINHVKSLVGLNVRKIHRYGHFTNQYTIGGEQRNKLLARREKNVYVT